MLTVALTGGIACGKSVVADILRKKGCFIRSADLVARELMSPDTAAWREIVDRFGPAILKPDRTIDRSQLGAIIFSDSRKRAALNAIVHPRVLEKEKAAIAALKKEGRIKIYVSEAALTLETGTIGFYDRILVVSCPPDVQLQRLMARDAIGREEALRKIRSQLSQEEKLRHADYVIDTSGTLAETLEQTERVYAMLLSDYENTKGRRSS